MTGNDLYPKHGNMTCGLDLNALSRDAAIAVSALNAWQRGLTFWAHYPGIGLTVTKLGYKPRRTWESAVSDTVWLATRVSP